jgi:hypothetical protein
MDTASAARSGGGKFRRRAPDVNREIEAARGELAGTEKMLLDTIGSAAKVGRAMLPGPGRTAARREARDAGWTVDSHAKLSADVRELSARFDNLQNVIDRVLPGMSDALGRCMAQLDRMPSAREDAKMRGDDAASLLSSALGAIPELSHGPNFVPVSRVASAAERAATDEATRMRASRARAAAAEMGVDDDGAA